MTIRSVAFVGTAALLALGLVTQGCGGDNAPTTGSNGGVTGMGGTSEVPASGGASTPETTGGGGTTEPVIIGSGGAAGTAGTSFEPLCTGLFTATGAEPAKNEICTEADPQLCYRTCGPLSIGFKSETCMAGVYVEQSGCSFPTDEDYSCFKIPDTFDASCPTDAPPQATVECNVAPCTLCNLDGTYFDSKGNAKTGYCVCREATESTPKWSCASTTAWPCPAGKGC